MAEHVWVVHRQTWAMQLMWAVDAKEAVRIGDYAYAPVSGYDPPHTRGTHESRVSRGTPSPQPRKAA